MVARVPARNRPLEHHCRLTGERLAAHSDERRRLGAAVHRDLSERDDPVADLARIDGGVQWVVGDRDISGRGRCNRIGGTANLEHAVLEHHEGDDLHPRVRVRRECQLATHLDALEFVIRHQVVGDFVPGGDCDLVVCNGDPVGRPGLRVRPPAGRDARDRRLRTEKRHAFGHATDLGRVEVRLLRQRRHARSNA